MPSPTRLPPPTSSEKIPYRWGCAKTTNRISLLHIRGIAQAGAHRNAPENFVYNTLSPDKDFCAMQTPSPELNAIQQQLPLMGYEIEQVHPERIIAVNMDGHRITTVDIGPCIGIVSMYNPIDQSNDTLLNLMLLANYANQVALLTRFYISDNGLFTAYAYCLKPYTPLAYSRTVQQMLKDLLHFKNHALVRYLR